MKQILMMLVFGLGSFAPALVAQSFDFRQLDRIGTHAKSSTNLNFDGDTLKLAAGFLGGDNGTDGGGVKGLVANMKALYIREWKFEKPGLYDDNDLEPLRTYLRPWKTILDVREDGEWTQIFMKPTADNKGGGFALVSSTGIEVDVIFVDGTLGMGDLLKLSGSLRSGDKSGDGKDNKKTNK